ncbi:MAG: polyprenol monophosphomannose synthase [bacterium]|nr:polyprenol monophosphomannose synthase [bacterium]
MKTTVVIPTYNEKENIGNLIETIIGLQIPDLSILVVDDSSPDGTGQIVQSYSQKFPPVSLFNRAKKEGLGRAYLAGFQEAINRGADTIIQMDADFSHDPNDILRFVNKIKTTDLVIGSRYMQGGKVSDWKTNRRLLSQWANIYARLVTGVPISDLTGGFKCWRTELLKKMNLATVHADGYGFQIEMNSRASALKAKISEMPIVFIDRRVGKSKISKSIIWEALWLVWAIRFNRHHLK